MTILVTGAGGTVGSKILAKLASSGAKVRALARDPDTLKLPPGMVGVKGDLTDVESMRAALEGVDTLFLLNAVAADELTQALVTLDLARQAGIRRFVYFSVFNGAFFADVPHFTAKYTVERAIDDQAIPATVLRPAYFMQNDAGMKDAILNGLFPMPIGSLGLAMADVRDIAEVAASELLRRENAPAPLPRTTIEIVGPDVLTGAGVAAIWSEALGRDVRYGGDDVEAFEQQAKTMMPGWAARDMRLMQLGFQRHGMVSSPDTVATLEHLLGHPLRRYRDFAIETAAAWGAG